MYKYFCRWFLGGIFFLTLPGYSQQTVSEISGIVFEDKNGNGVKDAGEKGLRNIPVSNGEKIELTDKNGCYTLQAAMGCSIFPILPADYDLPIPATEIRNKGFHYVRSSDVGVENIDFAFVRRNTVRSFAVAAVGDVQVGDAQEVDYANQTIMAELMEQKNVDFNIFLGDLVNNNMDLLPVLDRMIGGLPVVSWTLPGNHDRDVTEQPGRQDSSFNANFGASTYAFNYGEVHFIILNNVFPQGKRGYEGRLTERQFRFLESDLKLVPGGKLIVICQHIPFVYMRDRDRLLGVLKGRKVLAISGHTHQISRHFLQDSTMAAPVHELVAGTTCGNWWVGEKDWQGIPAALMQCGSPRGYFIVSFDGSDYQLRYKGVGLDASRQMDIWVNGTDSLDRNVEAFEALKGNEVIADIYGGSDSTRVYMQVDAGEWMPMEQVKIVAPYVSRLNAWNKAEIYPTRISRRGALRKQPSPHIWQSYLPDSLKKGVHSVRIRAIDNYGFEGTGSRMILKSR